MFDGKKMKEEKKAKIFGLYIIKLSNQNNEEIFIIIIVLISAHGYVSGVYKCILPIIIPYSLYSQKVLHPAVAGGDAEWLSWLGI